jgi:hypothetical protein
MLNSVKINDLFFLPTCLFYIFVQNFKPMENFITVTVKKCDKSGNITEDKTLDLKINIDLIGGFTKEEILLKSGNILNIGELYFTEIKPKKLDTVIHWG